MTQWSRPYQHIPLPLAFVRALFVSTVLMSPLVYVASRVTDETSWVYLIPLVAVVAVLQVLVWRHLFVGLEVGDQGIRLRSMWRQTIVPWAAVQRVLVVEDPQYRNWVLTIVTRDGTRVATPICQRTFRIARPPGPLGCVMLPAAELEALGHALDAMAVARNRQLRV
ncbi:MAG: PH domain-containing protein [Micromonosporaceae bacterium]|nr:PH domain-containing protein [Micromonosporaceae bacterium]